MEKWQKVMDLRMGQIFVAMLAGICSKEGTTIATRMQRLKNFIDEETQGRSNVIGWKRNGLNEEVGS